MNEYAIYHRPESEYAYALDENTLRIILRVAAGENFSHAELLYNNKYDFTKTRSHTEMHLVSTDGLFDYYGTDISLTDVRFAYIFKLYEKTDGGDTGDKIYYYSEAGLSETYDFVLAYYTFFQFPFINPSDVVKRLSWTDSAVFYQIFVDRFSRGDHGKYDGYITQEWNEIPTARCFAGGDLKGIISKLDYLAETGINALYLTPVFCADSNHKYNIKNYTVVDPQFGNNDDLRCLLTQAHDRNMRVMLDAVFNHCDMSHEFFCDAVKYGAASQYREYFLTDGDRPDFEKGNYAYFADCRYMPKWNTSNKKVREYLINIAVEYIKSGFDGLRLDVADEVSHTMWRELRKAVKTVNPDALLLGEVWHENTHYLRGDEFDGVMNYRVHKVLIDHFGVRAVSAEEAANRLNGILIQNYEQVNGMMLNFLDNHDTPRFLRLAGGNTDLVLSALVALIMLPGIPCIFYGTEFPMDGGSDPDCRRTFDWTFETRDEIYFSYYKSALALKRLRSVQSGGYSVYAVGDLLVIERRTVGETVKAYFNRSGAPCDVPAVGETVYARHYADGILGTFGAVVMRERGLRV